MGEGPGDIFRKGGQAEVVSDTVRELFRSIKLGGCTVKVLEKALADGSITREEHHSLISKLAKFLEGKVEVLELKEKILEEERNIDILTGLPKTVEPRLDKLITELNFPNENRRSNLNAIVVVGIDLNRFKILNDNYGHAVGDKALVACADRLRGAVKGAQDIVFRPHGDEFVVVMRIENDEVISDEAFEKRFQGFREAVNSGFSIDTINGKVPISLSMGYVMLRKDEHKSASQLLHEADLKMYEDKKGQD